MAFHGSQSSEEINRSKSKEMIETINLTREQQVEWFSFIVEKNDIEIAQHIKENRRIITAIMHFKTTRDCTCSLDSEICIPSDNYSKGEAIENLRTAISSGVCPHVQSSTSTESLIPSGIYWIHLAIITGKTNLIKILVPYLSNFEVQDFVFYTFSHKISPLDLALLHNNIELATLLIQSDNKQFSKCVLNSKSEESVTVTICKNAEAIQFLWQHFGSNFHRTRECWEELLRVCHEYGISFCASFLCSKGIHLERYTLAGQLVSAILAEDIGRVKICLLGAEVPKVCVDGLFQATRINNNEIATLILEKMRSVDALELNNYSLPYCIINSVFNHNIPVLKTLLKYGVDVNTTYHGLSLLRWTKILGLKNIEAILTNAGGRTYCTDEKLYTCFLTELVYLEVNTLNNVKILVEKGYNPNGSHMNITDAPVYAALRDKKYDVLEYLLLQGADLYLKRDTLNEFYSRFLPRFHFTDWLNFLIVLVKTNVEFDSCANPRIMGDLVSDKNCESLLEIILKTSHTLSQSDTDLLHKLETRDLPSSSIRMIKWWLHDVKSLKEACRNSLRRHYRYQFYNFTQKIESSIPLNILKYIRCEDVTEQARENISDRAGEFRNVDVLQKLRTYGRVLR